MRQIHIFLGGFILLLVATAGPTAWAGDQTEIPDTKQQTVKIDRGKNGAYRSGPWKYVYRITQPGTRSQGAAGELFYDDKWEILTIL